MWKRTKLVSKKEANEAQWIVDVAKERNYDLEHLFIYDLVDSSCVFEQNGLMKKTLKSTHCQMLEYWFLNIWFEH